jgi:hypothetical protein
LGGGGVDNERHYAIRGRTEKNILLCRFPGSARWSLNKKKGVGLHVKHAA